MRATDPTRILQGRPPVPGPALPLPGATANLRPMRLIVVLALLFAPPAFAREVRVGVLAYQGSERAAQDFAPTIDALNRDGPDRFVMVPLDLGGIAAAVAQGGIDFVITNPGDYIALESRAGVTRIATLESRDHAVPTDTVGSTVVVPAGPGRPKRLSDLAGERVAVVARDAFGGWLVIRRELLDIGIGASRVQLVETGYPMEAVIAALRTGRADAGVLRACLLEEEIAAGRVAPGEFIVLGTRAEPGFPCAVSSRLYPDWPFARLAGTPPDLAKTVAARLLTMAPVAGRAWTAPQDYTPVHALYRDLRIGPYDYLARPSIADYLRRHWHWFALAAMAVGWWLIHVARIETLVRRRTAELTREIAEREKAERAARQHREERDQFSRLGILGEMASSIAHELNQPLAAITNYAEGMTRAIDRGRLDPAFLRDGARGVAGQAERAGAIIRRIRTFMHRHEAHRAPVDLNEVVRAALGFFEATALRRGVPIRLALSDLPPVLADRAEIEQVLLNLMQNAVDAMGDGPHPKGIVISTGTDGRRVTVSVRDHGRGLTPEAEAHLFDAFFTTKPQGLGLGLSICRTIAESHGGRLWAEAAADGVTMHFALPAAEPEKTDG